MRVLRLAVGVLATLIMALYVHDGRSEPIRLCGEVVRQPDCLMFFTWFPPGEFVLPDTLEFTYPGDYFIAGDTYEGLPACGHPNRTTYLRDVIAVPCVVESLGCGTILQITAEPDCYLWASLTRDDSFPIKDLDGFAVGDTLLARGVVCRACPTISGSCVGTAGLLAFPHLSPCPSTVIPVMQPSWGQLKERFLR